MANGRSNFGFNVTGGSGGLANLVQAPKVTPARALSFAPTPRRIQRDEKDPKKQILGALLGASSPFLAEAGLAGLAKIPGLEDKLFKPDLDVRQEFGIVDPATGTATPTDPYLAEQRKLRQRIDAALPSTKLPRQKTTLGKGLAELLTFAPALAFADEDDGGGVHCGEVQGFRDRALRERAVAEVHHHAVGLVLVVHAHRDADGERDRRARLPVRGRAVGGRRRARRRFRGIAKQLVFGGAVWYVVVDGRAAHVAGCVARSEVPRRCRR